MKDLGKVIRRLRQWRGMKQSHLAELLAVTQATVSRWESNAEQVSQRRFDEITAILAPVVEQGQDSALRRLVESAAYPVHLVCDVTHRLLAASPARERQWGRTADELRGESLMRYATDEIIAAEAELEPWCWSDIVSPTTRFSTPSNRNDELPIQGSVALWERVMLQGGAHGRLVTTLQVL